VIRTMAGRVLLTALGLNHPVPKRKSVGGESGFVWVASSIEQRAVPRARPRRWPITLHIVPVIALAWFVVSFAGILWMWGGSDPHFFPSPDESVDRSAAELVAATGRPDLNRGAQDPEDLRHGRTWVSVDDKAIPAYPPLPYYVQAAIIKTPLVGAVGVPLLSALGVAAFVAGLGALGRERRWAAALAPLVAFPAFYWMMRPWMNMATVLSFASISFFCWSHWRTTRSNRWLWAMIGMTAFTAALRPDYAPLVLAVGLLATLGSSPAGDVRRIVVCFVMAAGLAVGVNLLLNALTTGDPLKAAYEIWASRRPDAGRSAGGVAALLSKVRALLTPEGRPSLALLRDQFSRYWLQMGPIALLAIGQLAIIPLLWRAKRPVVFSAAGVIAVAVLFMVSRTSADAFGGSDTDAVLRHSVPRYWAPIYLMAAVPPLLLIMRSKDMRAWTGTAALCGVLALFGARELYKGQPESMVDIHNYEASWRGQIDDWRPWIPNDAVVYSGRLDKVLWSEWEIATFPQPFDADRLASSVARTVRGGRRAFIVEPQWDPYERSALEMKLAAHGLTLAYVGAHLVYEAAPAQRSLTVYALDLEDNWAAVNVTVANVDSTSPATRITSPANGATVFGAVDVSAIASDAVGVQKVRFWVDNYYLSFDATPPYTKVWDTTSYGNGPHLLTIEALDSSDNSAVMTQTVFVNN
jgi:hypothetical protein